MFVVVDIGGAERDFDHLIERAVWPSWGRESLCIPCQVDLLFDAFGFAR